MYNHRVVVQCLRPVQDGRAQAEPRQAEAGSQGSAASPEPPCTLPGWMAAQGCHEGLISPCTLRIYLVLGPACSAVASISLKGENRRAGYPAPETLEDAREEDYEQRIEQVEHVAVAFPG